MDAQVKSYLPEKLFSVVRSCKSVITPLEFFNWLQNSVMACIPHKVLLSVRGNFMCGVRDKTLHFDFVSETEGFKSSVLSGANPEVNQCMAYLHQLWLENHRHYYVLNNVSTSEFGCKLRKIFPQLPKDIHSVLVFGVSDFHGEKDCLYMFFSDHHKFQITNGVVGFLMPHIDHLLRRIKHVVPATPPVKTNRPLNLAALTEREMEVIDWIKVGKTNQEIAMILTISENTVKSHLKRIYHKLNVSKRAQAVALLAKH